MKKIYTAVVVIFSLLTAFASEMDRDLTHQLAMPVRISKKLNVISEERHCDYREYGFYKVARALRDIIWAKEQNDDTKKLNNVVLEATTICLLKRYLDLNPGDEVALDLLDLCKIPKGSENLMAALESKSGQEIICMLTANLNKKSLLKSRKIKEKHVKACVAGRSAEAKKKHPCNK